MSNWLEEGIQKLREKEALERQTRDLASWQEEVAKQQKIEEEVSQRHQRLQEITATLHQLRDAYQLEELITETNSVVWKNEGKVVRNQEVKPEGDSWLAVALLYGYSKVDTYYEYWQYDDNGGEPSGPPKKMTRYFVNGLILGCIAGINNYIYTSSGSFDPSILGLGRTRNWDSDRSLGPDNYSKKIPIGDDSQAALDTLKTYIVEDSTHRIERGDLPPVKPLPVKRKGFFSR